MKILPLFKPKIQYYYFLYKRMSQPYNFTKSLPKLYSLEAYLDREAKVAHKSSYHNGNIIKMAGAKARHNEIAMNIGSAIKFASKSLATVYRLYNSDQKIYIEQENTVVYPDAVVVSIAPAFWQEREDLITNPLLIIEVLSKSTEKHDKGSKFMLYQNLPSFKEYVLVSQDRLRVEVWSQIQENHWQRTVSAALTDNIVLQSMENIQIALADIYENIEM
jgi:Uma2 family endonuclease